MLNLWRQIWPEQRQSVQCLSSRYYRDNKVVQVDENGVPMFAPNGKPILIEAKVRNRTTPQGKLLDMPFTLVEKHPERACKYEWVKKEHKSVAGRILSGDLRESTSGESSRHVVRGTAL